MKVCLDSDVSIPAASDRYEPKFGVLGVYPEKGRKTKDIAAFQNFPQRVFKRREKGGNDKACVTFLVSKIKLLKEAAVCLGSDHHRGWGRCGTRVRQVTPRLPIESRERGLPSSPPFTFCSFWDPSPGTDGTHIGSGLVSSSIPAANALTDTLQPS